MADEYAYFREDFRLAQQPAVDVAALVQQVEPVNDYVGEPYALEPVGDGDFIALDDDVASEDEELLEGSEGEGEGEGRGEDGGPPWLREPSRLDRVKSHFLRLHQGASLLQGLGFRGFGF